MPRILSAVPLTLIFAIIAGLVGCSRDPNVRKHKYFESGQRYFEQGKLDEAAIEFRNAIGLDPAYAEAHYQLALVYLNQQQWPRAAQELARTTELQPANYSARAEMAKLLIAGGDLRQAQEQVDWLLHTRPDDAQSHSVAADLLAARNNLPAALQEAQKAVAIDPGSANIYVKLALIQLRGSQAEAAETSFKKAIELDPKAVAPRLMLANYYQVRSRFAEAELQLRGGIQANTGNPEPVAALARLYLAEGKKADAEQLLIQSKRNFADNSVGYRLLGDFYLGSGDLDKATAEYRTLYHDHPRDLQVKKNFTDLLIHTNQPGEAANVDEEILKADPNDNDGLIYRGQLQLRDRDTNGAISTFQTVIKNDPNNALGHYHLGIAFQKSGAFDTAESELRDAVRLRPDLTDAQRTLGILAMRSGDMTTLAQTSTQLIALRPSSAEGYALRAVSEINRKQFGAAETDAHKAIEVAPGSAAGYVQLGNLNFAQQRFKDAETGYRSALDRDPRSNDALRGLMNTYVALKRTDAAISAATLQIAKVPDSSGFYDLLGTALFQQKKDLSGAQAALEKSVLLDKNNTDALMKLGEVQAATGHTEEAVRTFENGAKDNPQEPGFFILLGQIFQSRKDWARAEAAYQKALVIRRDDPIAACNLAYVILQSGGDLDIALSLAQTARRRMPASADAADTLGWIYFQKGAYRSAIDSLRAALTLVQEAKSQDNPRFHYHLGMAYAKSGEIIRAREQLQKVLTMSPESNDAGEARRTLSQLKS